MKFCVITKTPKPETGGNLAMVGSPIYRQVEEGNATNGWLGKFEVLKLGAAIFDLRQEVFHVGEVLILDGEYGRELAYPGRKPSKWGVDTEHFDTAEEAVARARELLDG